MLKCRWVHVWSNKLIIENQKHDGNNVYLTNKEAWAVYNTVIKYDGHLSTQGKCRKSELQVSDNFYISQEFSNVQASSFVFRYSSYICKTIKHGLSMVYTLIKHGFLTNQSMCRVQIILYILYMTEFMTTVSIICTKSSKCILISQLLRRESLYYINTTYSEKSAS